MKRMLADLLTALVGTLAAAVAAAGTSTFSGSIAPGDPTMPVVNIVTPDCASQGSAPVAYRAIPFTVDASGNYAITAPYANNAVHVYAGAFDPAAPLANCIAASNASPHNLTEALAAGTNYVLVVTEDRSPPLGTRFDVTITGPGNIHGPCAGFSDVDAGNSFCSNVHWLRNRAVTLGCTATSYCPNDPVTRLQMAAFLNRLANALEPVFRTAADTAIHAAVNAGDVVCQTPVYDLTGYPRVVSSSSAMLYPRAPGAVRVSTRLVYSTDAGGTWTPFGAQNLGSTNPSGEYASQSPSSSAVFLLPPQSVIFGIDSGVTSATLNDAGCELTVRLDSHTGAAAPFDAPMSTGPRASGPGR